MTDERNQSNSTYSHPSPSPRDTASDDRFSNDPADHHVTSSSPSTPTDHLCTTEHVLHLPDRDLRYTAITGTRVLCEELTGSGGGETGGSGSKAVGSSSAGPSSETGGRSGYSRAVPYAEVFSVSYIAQDRDPQRPVVFAFNGGPGSSTVWLHLGMLGPKRVDSGDVDHLTPPPYGLHDNLHTVLRDADLVCIDPMTTGFTRPTVGQQHDRHHGFEADRDLVASFIIDWLTRHNRWLSPKFILGESYGTTRAAALAGHLFSRYYLALNGVVLISPVLDFATLLFNQGNDSAYVHYLPTYAAIAHYHGKHEGRSLEEVVAEATAFADGPYQGLLAAGHRLTAVQRREAVQSIAGLTGLHPDYVDRANLRIEHQHFFAELLRDQHRLTGRIDGRFTMPAGDANAATADDDPSISALAPAYTAGINHYLSSDLGFHTDIVYEVMSARVYPWSYSSFENCTVNVSEDLASAMRAVPALRVLVMHGYHDGATPFHASEHALAHLAIPEQDYHSRLRVEYYPAGHMMYVHEPSRIAMSQHLSEFIADDSAQNR
ncbi:S10 family peptidase [Devriesea agamarum]|uniref:S10 family peptidase n=1 Tax=Devriesea agamarum TaxID=472569 RepID=UPI0009FC2517|nr:carboxypeptidase [Devriesea agamarum]